MDCYLAYRYHNFHGGTEILRAAGACCGHFLQLARGVCGGHSEISPKGVDNVRWAGMSKGLLRRFCLELASRRLGLLLTHHELGFSSTAYQPSAREGFVSVPVKRCHESRHGRQVLYHGSPHTASAHEAHGNSKNGGQFHDCFYGAFKRWI